MCSHTHTLCLDCPTSKRSQQITDGPELAYGSISMDYYRCLCSRTRGLHCLAAMEFGKASKPSERKTEAFWEAAIRLVGGTGNRPGYLTPRVDYDPFFLRLEPTFEIADDRAQYLPNGCKRLTLTARGVALLASCGHLPNISEAEIKDKSKANNVAKALVIIQASWMLVQVHWAPCCRLTRHSARRKYNSACVSGYPFVCPRSRILLTCEMMCAFLMCAMWWHKPLAPKEPILLKGDWVKPLCAYMYMSSEMSGGGSMRSQSSRRPQ